MRKPKKVVLSLQDRAELERWSGDQTLPARQRLRADVLLMADQGIDHTAIAARHGITRQTCGRIRERFLEEGLQAMVKDRPRSGRRKRIDPQQILTLTTYWPPAPATDWTRALLAKEIGVSASTVGRIWQRNGLNPQEVARFKVIGDARSAKKLEAIAGLYLAPLQRTLVLCVDMKTQIQPLAHMQPHLPLRQGRPRARIQGYERQRLRTLFAGISAVEATVCKCHTQSRSQNWLRFLQQIDKKTPPDRRLYVIHHLPMDMPNVVHRWPTTPPRIRMRTTANRDFWLKVVERFFRVLTTRPPRRVMIESMAQLEAAIMDYIAAPETPPKPFIWTAKVADIRVKGAAR